MNPKQEAERLMNAILPLAERMLREHGEFYPFGGYIKPDGTIVEVGAADSHTDHPKSKDLIHVLWSSFREMAESNRCKAVAVIFDVAVTLPNSNRKGNAIQACLEHADGYSVEVFFPYEMTNDAVVYGETFAQQGQHRTFGQVGPKETA